jgi:glycosyltransferase involved in cell wall biosynthesis
MSAPESVRAEARERITYLIASYNRAAYLRDCLASLLAQTSADWLAVVVDDASTDDSLSVLTNVSDARVRCLQNPRNLGYIATLQRLLEEATTDIVGVLDADDALEPPATALLLAAYADRSDAGFVYSRFGEFDEALGACIAQHGKALPPRGTAMLDGPIGHIRTFRRSVYRRTAGLDPTMLYAEDRDLVYKLEEVSPPVFVDALLYRYRQLPDSQSHDSTRRETGLRNTLRARRAALRRRGVRGRQRLVWECWARFDFAASSRRYPRPVQWLASHLASGAAAWLRFLRAGDRRPTT